VKIERCVDLNGAVIEGPQQRGVGLERIQDQVRCDREGR